MKLQEIKMLIACGVAVTAMVVIATPPGPYSLNVLFVPPLVDAKCNFLQFWNPPNMTCAMCFCFTGRLSRCIPQPGCNPNNSTSSTTTPGPPGNEGNMMQPPQGGSNSTSHPIIADGTEATAVNTTTNSSIVEGPLTSTDGRIRNSRSPRFENFGEDY